MVGLRVWALQLNKKTQLGIVMLNAGSHMNKIDDFKHLMSLSHIDLIGVTQTRQHNEPKDHNVNLQGCALFHPDRPSSKRKGRDAPYEKSNVRLQFVTVFNGIFSATPHASYSAFANSCPLQTDTFLFPLIHSHNVLLSSNKFY